MATKHCTPVSLILLGLQAVCAHSEVIGGAADPPTPTIQDMRVDHRGAHIPMPEQFLDRPDVIAVFQQMRGERMAEAMAACGFGDAGLEDRLFYRALQNGFVQVVPAPLPRSPVGIMTGRWKDPLPGPRSACIRVFALQGVGQGNPTQPFPEVFFVLPFDSVEVPEKRLFRGPGKDRIAIFIALAAPNHDLVPGKLDILDSQPTTFHHS